MGAELVRSPPLPAPKQNLEWPEFPTGMQLGWGGQGLSQGDNAPLGTSACCTCMWGGAGEGAGQAGQVTEGLVSQVRIWEYALEMRGRR